MWLLTLLPPKLFFLLQATPTPFPFPTPRPVPVTNIETITNTQKSLGIFEYIIAALVVAIVLKLLNDWLER